MLFVNSIVFDVVLPYCVTCCNVTLERPAPSPVIIPVNIGLSILAFKARFDWRSSRKVNVFASISSLKIETLD